MEKQIHSEGDISKWKRSPAYHLFCSFYSNLNEEFVGLYAAHSEDEVHDFSKQLICLFAKLTERIKDFPCQAGSRFGNRAFRDWHVAACHEISAFMKRTVSLFALPSSIPLGRLVVPVEPDDASTFLSGYLVGSLGNATRIDYGTGHEMNFVIFLYLASILCAHSKEPLSPSSLLILLRKYFELIRTLIKIYKLEPAGSHGVWGLDDYQFMPFLLGSAQLKSQSQITPNSVFMANRPAAGLFFEGIDFIHQYKSGPFSEHSPILHQICSTLSWPQINQGLCKMYRAEVMDKFPVVQHLYFCKLFPFQ